jgi:Flp pilus assembly protein TadG
LGKRRSAQAMIEMAFVLPMLLLLSAGVLQYAVVLYTYNQLRNITRDCARYSALNIIGYGSGFNAVLAARLKNDCFNTFIRYSDITAFSTNPAPGSATATKNSPMTLTVTYDMSKKLFMPKFFTQYGIYPGTATASITNMIE